MTMCHSHELDYTEDIFTQQVVAVNLKEVSDIIEPLHVKVFCFFFIFQKRKNFEQISLEFLNFWNLFKKVFQHFQLI